VLCVWITNVLLDLPPQQYPCYMNSTNCEYPQYVISFHPHISSYLGGPNTPCLVLEHYKSVLFPQSRISVVAILEFKEDGGWLSLSVIIYCLVLNKRQLIFDNLTISSRDFHYFTQFVCENKLFRVVLLQLLLLCLMQNRGP
jgi:hypothetical protein